MDTERKLENIVTDYYKAIGKYNNAKHIYEAGEYKILPTDDDETKKIKKGQQEELLVDLGRIGEMCFKYAIKLWQVTNFPNQSYEEFQDKSLEKLITRGVANTYKNQYHLDPTKVDAINQFQDETGQPRHNFSYLYKIIELLMPDLKDKFMDVMRLGIKSRNAEHFLEKFWEAQEAVVFPEQLEISTIAKKKPEIAFLIRQRNTSLMMDGDIFTRLRYFDMNETNTKLYTEEDIDHIFELISDIVLFAKLIHLNKDNIDFNPEIMFSKEKLDNWDYYGYNKKLPNHPQHVTGLTKEQRDYFYFHPKLKDDVKNLYYFLRYTNTEQEEIPVYIADALDSTLNTFEENKEILECDFIKSENYCDILENGLNLGTIKHFLNNTWINNTTEMSKYSFIRKPKLPHNVLSEGDLKKCIKTVEKELYELKKLTENPNATLDVFKLSSFMEINTIKELVSNSKLYNFFTNEFIKDIFPSGYYYTEDFYHNLFQIKELQDNPIAWFGLDEQQLAIYAISCKYSHTNKGELYDFENITKNIKENIDFFKDTPQLLCVIPLMLDCDANNIILSILIKNGLDINNLKGFDSTILCYPVPLVELIETIFVGNGIPLIVNNNVNSEFRQVLQNVAKDNRIPSRRLHFYDCAEPTNPIIKSLFFPKSKVNENDTYCHEEYGEKVKEIITKMNSLDSLEFKKFYLESYKRKSKVLYGEDEENIKLT